MDDDSTPGPPQARTVQRPISLLARIVSTIVTLMGIAGLLGVVTEFRSRDLGFRSLLELLTGCLIVSLGTSIWRQDERGMRSFLGLLFAALSLDWISGVFTSMRAWSPWSEIAIAAVWLALAIGFWRAEDWARRLCSIWGWCWIAYEVVDGIVEIARSKPRLGVTEVSMMVVMLPVIALPFLALATYGQRDRTIRHFARVREARVSA